MKTPSEILLNGLNGMDCPPEHATYSFDFVAEQMESYAKKFTKAELQKLKEEIDKHVERTVDDTECDHWDGGFKVCAIDAKIIIDKRIGEL